MRRICGPSVARFVSNNSSDDFVSKLSSIVPAIAPVSVQ
jgi:hypothetical protein